MRTRALLLAVAAVVLPAFFVVEAAEATPPKDAKVTYVTTYSVYVDVGALDGVAVGDRMDVIEGDAAVVGLKVTFTSEHKAVCLRVSGTRAVVVGDIVRYTPSLRVESSTSASATRSGRGTKGPGLHGRIGLSYLTVRQTGAGDAAYHQPAGDVRLDGRELFGAPLDVSLDARARRTYRTVPDGANEAEGRTRFYRAFVAWQPRAAPFRVTVGRQSSPALASVSIFDGAMAEYRKTRWSAGLFGGTQPDPVNYALSSDIREYGGYVEFGNPAAAETHWAVTSGAIRSLAHGDVNRDFVFVQGRYDDRKLSAYVVEEVDYNRGWKKDAEGKTWSSTSTYGSLRYRVVEAFAFDAGYDSRRSVRLYRDIDTPATEFDDQHRRGVWAGVSGRVAKMFSYGLNARQSDGSQGAKANAYTLNLGLARFVNWDFDISTRSTRYTNDYVRGWLHSLSLSSALADWVRVELYGGLRTETTSIATAPAGKLHWFGLNWDLNLGRHFFFILSAERNQSDDEGNQQFYTTLTYRF